MPVEVDISPDYDALSRAVADRIIRTIAARPDALIVVPTGSTPLGVYDRLVADAAADRVDFSRMRMIQLDEYQGIAADDARSLHGWLDRVFLTPAGVHQANVIRFDSAAPDIDAELDRVARMVAASGGIDLAVLGLGPNGHLGFNEPGSSFDAPVQRITLTPESIRSNGAYWGDEDRVPRCGFTLGIGTLRGAKRTILMVSGAHKADILARSLYGPVTRDLPATILQTMENVTVMADADAAAGLDVS